VFLFLGKLCYFFDQEVWEFFHFSSVNMTNFVEKNSPKFQCHKIEKRKKENPCNNGMKGVKLRPCNHNK
jgi:hypothetical protein